MKGCNEIKKAFSNGFSPGLGYVKNKSFLIKINVLVSFREWNVYFLKNQLNQMKDLV